MTATPIPPRHHRPDHDNNDHHDDHNTNDNHGNAYIFYYNIIDGFDEYDGCGAAPARASSARVGNNCGSSATARKEEGVREADASSISMIRLSPGRPAPHGPCMLACVKAVENS